jgi:positive regulator of sigma E activity
LKWIRRVLTKEVSEFERFGRGKKSRRVQVLPSEKLVLGVAFAIVALLCLVILEVAYLIVMRTWSSEIFAVISGLIGTIVGVFFGVKA